MSHHPPSLLRYKNRSPTKVCPRRMVPSRPRLQDHLRICCASYSAWAKQSSHCGQLRSELYQEPYVGGSALDQGNCSCCLEEAQDPGEASLRIVRD